MPLGEAGLGLGSMKPQLPTTTQWGGEPPPPPAPPLLLPSSQALSWNPECSCFTSSNAKHPTTVFGSGNEDYKV